jgi:hypothetical protein
MNSLQNIKIVSNSNGSAGTQITASADTRGFGYALVIHNSCDAGTVSTACKVEHSDDNSTWEAMTGLVAGTDYTIGTGSVASTQPKFVLGFPLKGRKRYLKATVGGVSSRQAVNIILSDGSDSVSSATDAGVTNIFFR